MARASRYRRIEVSWVDDERLVRASGDAFQAYWAIRCGPAMGPCVGLCRGGVGLLMDQRKWDYERAAAALSEMSEAGLVVLDTKANLIFFPGVASAVPPPNIQSMKAALAEVHSMPESPLRKEIAQELAQEFEQMSDKDKGGKASALLSALLGDGCVAATQPQHSHNTTAAYNHRADSNSNSREESTGESTPKIRPPSISFEISQKQQRFVEDLLTPHGLTPAAWLAANGGGLVFTPAHVDQVVTQYKGRTGDPAEREKQETYRRNAELRRLRIELQSRFEQDPTTDFRAWITSAAPGPNHRQQLLEQLKEMEAASAAQRPRAGEALVAGVKA